MQFTMEKLDKFIRQNFLFIVIVLAICFAFWKKATIWQQSTEPIKPVSGPQILNDSLKVSK
jgi:hypothetical protein